MAPVASMKAYTGSQGLGAAAAVVAAAPIKKGAQKHDVAAAAVFACAWMSSERPPRGHYLYITKTLRKRLCVCYFWNNMVRGTSWRSSWTKAGQKCASTLAETIGPSAQDRYYANSLGGGAKKWVLCDLCLTRFDLAKSSLFDFLHDSFV